MTPLAAAFRMQAESCANLGSDFTAKLCTLMAARLGDDSKVGAFLHEQPDPNYRYNAVPLRLTGALHALVLQGIEPALTAAYPPNTVTDDALWEAIMHSMRTHQDHVLHWLQSAPQTNEIRRCAALIPGFHLIAQLTGLPLVMSELGASAGLNLGWDRFGLNLDGQIWGDRQSPVQINPQWRGPLPAKADIVINNRAGCDINPLDPANPDDRLRLQSYIWPDQPERMAATRRAMDMAAASGQKVQRMDAIDFLQERLAQAHPNTAHVIYHSIMWQYLPDAARKRGEGIISAAGERATTSAPVAWLRMEGDDTGQPGAAIILTIWPTGKTRQLGRVDFHGRWVEWF